MSNLIILGAGGHGKVVAEAAELEGRWDEIAFLDDSDDLNEVLGFKVMGKLDDCEHFIGDYEHAIVAIGNNEVRLEWIAKLQEAGFSIPVIVHPKAFVSKHAEVREGTVVLAGAVVNAGTSVGKGCIVNVNATIDHDCSIGDGVHVCSGALVRSMCKVGRLCFIGAGALIRECSCMDEHCKLCDGHVMENEQGDGLYEVLCHDKKNN